MELDGAFHEFRGKMKNFCAAVPFKRHDPPRPASSSGGGPERFAPFRSFGLIHR